MAFSYHNYTGDNSTTTFNIPFTYTATSEISVTVDGVAETGLTFPSSTEVTLTSAPASGTLVQVRRTTVLTSRTVDFVSGSVLTEEDLDNSNIQVFHAAQEAVDKSNDGITLGADDKWDAQSKVIKNVADPVANTDAVNKQFISTNLPNITTVAGIASDVTTVANNDANVTAVAADATDIGTVSTNIASVNTVATNISDVITVANDLNEAISEIETAADDLNEAVSEIDTVATSISSVNTVGTNIANVTTVANNDANVTTVAGNTTNINTVAGISGNVTTVAGVSANVTTVAGISSDVTTVAGDSADIQAVAADATDIGTVSTNIANVNTVAGSIANVNTTASNITGVNSFAERYRVGSSDPTTSLDEGDLFFNTTSNEYKFYDGSAWQAVNVSGLGSVLEDTTPQLGGDLDLNSNNITGTGNINITGHFTATDGSTITTADNSTQLTLKSTDADANEGPRLDFIRDSASPADNDRIGIMRFLADNDAGTETNYAEISATLRDVSDGTLGSELRFAVTRNNTLKEVMSLSHTDVILNESGEDINVRIESSANANMFKLDGGINKIGIGKAPTQGLLDVNGAVFSTGLTVDSTTLHVDGSSNNVGIGTTAPADKLHVYKGASGLSTFSSNTAILIEDNGPVAIQFATPNTSNQQIVFSDPEDNTAGKIQYQHSTNLMTFDTDGDESMRITAGHAVVGRSEGGTVNRVSFTSGSAKSWVTFDMDSNNAILDDYNVSSLSDNATGKNTVNIDNNMNNVNYGITFGFEDDSSNVNAVKLQDSQIPTTGAYKVQGGAFQNGSTNTQFDVNRVYCVTHGRQA